MNEMVHPAAFAAVEGGRVRVAVVEDDDTLRDLLVADLADRGVLTYGVASAEELYRQMVVSPVDVVVLDLGLPGEDGHSVSRHLRRRGDVGIVVVTGRGGRRGLEQAMRNGADLFIAKPVDTDALVAAVEALHQRLRQRARASAPDAHPLRWSLRQDGWTLRSPSGAELTLTAAERAFLRPLFAAPGKPVHRDRLIRGMTDAPWDFNPPPAGRARAPLARTRRGGHRGGLAGACSTWRRLPAGARRLRASESRRKRP